MVDIVQKNIKIRIEKEFKIWDENVDKNVSEKEYFKTNIQEWDNFIHQHTLFSKYEGVEKILFYLLGKTSNTSAQLLNNQLSK